MALYSIFSVRAIIWRIFFLFDVLECLLSLVGLLCLLESLNKDLGVFASGWIPGKGLLRNQGFYGLGLSRLALNVYMIVSVRLGLSALFFYKLITLIEIESSEAMRYRGLGMRFSWSSLFLFLLFPFPFFLLFCLVFSEDLFFSLSLYVATEGKYFFSFSLLYPSMDSSIK